jgi:hypothetical protein
MDSRLMLEAALLTGFEKLSPCLSVVEVGLKYAASGFVDFAIHFRVGIVVLLSPRSGQRLFLLYYNALDMRKQREQIPFHFVEIRL